MQSSQMIPSHLDKNPDPSWKPEWSFLLPFITMSLYSSPMFSFITHCITAILDYLNLSNSAAASRHPYLQFPLPIKFIPNIHPRFSFYSGIDSNISFLERPFLCILSDSTCLCPCTTCTLTRYSSFQKKFTRTIFLDQFYIHSITEHKVQRFPTYFLLFRCIAIPIANIPNQSSRFVAID